MNTISVNRLESIARLINSASKDQIRYGLTYVNLKSNESREVIAESTNGHCLAEINLGVIDGLSEFLENSSIAFSPDDIKRLNFFLKSLPKLQKLVEFRIEKNQIILHHNETPNYFGCKIDYPKTSQLWPNLPNDALEFCFDAQTLMNLFKSLNDAPKTHKSVKIKIDTKNPKSAPMIVSVSGNKGILMPMRF